jgi:hypothetical protein
MYKVYFEVFGKKMKTDVFANSEEEAKKKVIERIVFHKVERHNEKSIVSALSEFFGLK